MENINFIPANELPEAEGDEVSVLCVENGELKQKAASGLGGNNYDIVVRVAVIESEDGISATGEIISGSFEAVVQKLDDVVMPVGLIVVNETRGNGVKFKFAEEFTPRFVKTPDDNEFIEIWTDGWGYILSADGTVEIN